MLTLDNVAIRTPIGMGSRYSFSALTKVRCEPAPSGVAFHVNDTKDFRVVSFYLTPDQIHELWKATQ